MNITELLSSIDNSVLTEESKNEISKVFEKVVSEQVESKIDGQVKIAVETAMLEQDASHSKQLNELLEAIDQDHSNKLKKWAVKLDEERTQKLQQVVDHYEGLLSEESKKLVNSLQTDISNFFFYLFNHME